MMSVGDSTMDGGTVGKKQWNSPNKYYKKCMESTKENFYIDIKVKPTLMVACFLTHLAVSLSETLAPVSLR